MQVFKCYLKIVRQNIGLIAMYLAIFITLCVAFSGMGADNQLEQYTDTKVPMTVVDRDGSDISRSITGILTERHEIVPLPDDTETLRDALYNRETTYILFIPNGYGERLLSGNAPILEDAQVSGSANGAYIDRLLEGYVATLQVYLDAGFPAQDALLKAEADLAKKAEVSMTHSESQEATGIFYFYKYLSYSILLTMIFGLCPVLMVFAKRNIAMRMESSALPFRRKNFEIGLGILTFAGIFYAVFLVIGYLMYGSSMFTQSSLICLLNMAAFLATSAALAFLVGQVASSANVLAALANVIGLGMSFLGGVFVPLELMSEGLQKIAQLFPTYWYIHVADMALGTGSTSEQFTSEMAQSIGVQLLFAAAFLAVALVVARQRRRRVA
ncbi:MAG TPA: hypothetical protein DEB31_08370 [Clostridiales bacterium]|nr:hypothetical protein [Clostridiales bacterium]